jgi:hypothetical protein
MVAQVMIVCDGCRTIIARGKDEAGARRTIRAIMPDVSQHPDLCDGCNRKNAPSQPEARRGHSHVERFTRGVFHRPRSPQG